MGLLPSPAECAKDERWVAALLGVKPATLQKWRRRGQGPPYFRAGRAVRYWPAEVQAWARRQGYGGKVLEGRW